MGFELFCMTLIALLVGLAICFGGYRWFLILLPIFGFFLGFGLGAQTLQALFGIGFISTVTSWVVGFITGLAFALFSYLFYFIGVALVAGAFGYALGVGFMGLFGFDLAFLTWLVGIIVGVVVAVATLLLNIQKWVIIAITSFGGAGVIIGSFLFTFGIIQPEQLGENAVQAVLADSPFWMISFLILGILGVIVQFYSSRAFVLEAPDNRLAAPDNNI